MSFFEWDPQYSVGIDMLDEHHKVFIGLLNRVHELMVEDDRSEELKKIVDELIDYATYHFHFEERWMAELQYGGLDAHREEHDYFSRRVVEIQMAVIDGKPAPCLEALGFLRGWFARHVLETDTAFAPLAIARK